MAEGSAQTVVMFSLDERRFALRLEAVDRVERAVAVDPLPGAPAVVRGVINCRGRVLPVVDPRQRFGLPLRELELGDQLILARTLRREVALIVDQVDGLAEIDEEQTAVADNILPGLRYVDGVARLADGLVLVHDLARFLSLEEADALEGAINRHEGGQRR